MVRLIFIFFPLGKSVARVRVGYRLQFSSIFIVVKTTLLHTMNYTFIIIILQELQR